MSKISTIKYKYKIANILYNLNDKINSIKKRFSIPAFRKAEHLAQSYAISPSRFDAEYYLESYPDLQGSSIDPFVHFFLHGLEEGRKARFFNSIWYLNEYPDVRALGNDAYFHYAQYGKKEHREARFVYLSSDEVTSRRAHYGDWLKTHHGILNLPYQEQLRRMSRFKRHPLISIVMPVYNAPTNFLIKAIDSVISQSYENWELCIADDASSNQAIRPLLEEYAQKDGRIKLVFRQENGHISKASNSALEMAKGEYIALLDHDDMLPADALFWVADAIDRAPEVDIIFSDEDKIDDQDKRFEPYFKSNFNYELLLAQNMISHLGVYRRSLVELVGGFREGLEGSQDHDLALRVLEKTLPERVRHIPRILYHWRAIAGSTAMDIGEKSYATQAGVKAVADHLERKGIEATVEVADPKIGHYRVRYALKSPLPLVSIIIPTRDHVNLLRTCIESLLSLTTYPNYEIIIIDNGSVEKETAAYLDKLPKEKIHILSDKSPFNYSKLNNKAVQIANGQFIILMNNDIEIITPDWLEEMLSFAQMTDVGCVGARLWFPDYTIQHAGVVLGLGGVAGHIHKHFDRRSKGYFCRAAHHQSFSAVTAACLAVRKDIYLSVGGLDENLAVAFNDVDFCLKVQAAGYRNVWTPYAEMFHHESASRGAETTDEKRQRFNYEVEIMQSRWANILQHDPAYNPNLSLEHTDFSFAWPPRLDG